MNPALLLKDANAAHQTLVKELGALFEKLDADTKATRFDDKPERLVVPFDLMLQFDLLKIALGADKKEECLKFLHGMGYFHYDVFKYLKEYATIRYIDVDATWDNILQFSPEGQARVLFIMEAGIKPLWDDALNAMAKSDLVVEKDVFQIFQDNIYRIVDCFLMVDERNSDTEIRKAIETVRISMMLPIIDANDELFKRTDTKK